MTDLTPADATKLQLRKLESSIALAVNHRSEYQQPLAIRLSQLASGYDALSSALTKAHAEIARLREALGNILDGYGLNAPLFERQPEDDEDDWIVTIARAALAPLEEKTK